MPTAAREPRSYFRIPGQRRFRITPILKELLDRHSVPTKTDGRWLVADSGIRATGAVVKEYPSPKGTSNIQLDFYFVLEDGRLLIESVGGFGVTRAGAVNDGVGNFTGGSFHVLLSSLFNVKADDQIETEHWNIAGKSRHKHPIINSFP